MRDPHLDGMLRALSDEIRHRSRDEHAERYELSDGWLEGRDSCGLWLYVFHMPDLCSLGRADAARLELAGERFDVGVLRSSADRVLISSPVSLPEPLDRATLVVTDTTMLEIIRDRLQSAASGALAGFNTALAMRLLEPLKAVRPRAEEGDASAVISGLNPGQSRAVDRAREAETLMIWGPAGTGKSRTLAELIRDRMAHGRRTLAVAPSNLAVDGLVRTVAEGVAPEDLQRSVVVRYGAIRDGAMPRGLRHDTSFDEIVERRRIPLLERLSDLHDEYRWAMSQLSPIRDEALSARIEELRAGMADLEAAIRVIPAEVLGNAQVVLTTVARATLGQVGTRYDTVVIDEGGMVSSADAYLVAGLARASVIVGGDFRQLGPVVSGRSPAIDRWLRQSIFEETGASTCPNLNQTDRALALHDQYRMTGGIQRLANAVAYGGVLREARPSRSLAGLPEVGLVDTAALGAIATRPRRGGRANAIHSMVVARLLSGAISANPDLCPRTEIGVITPYRAQAREIRQGLAENEVLRHVPVGTVHRFQGRERRLIILDLPDGPPFDVSYFMQASDLSQDGGRLLTVALTRAQESLIVLGHRAYLERRAPAGAVVRAFLAHIAEMGVEIPVETFAPSILTQVS